MNKRVGDFEVTCIGDETVWATIFKHYNESTVREIRLNSIEDIHDLEHVVRAIKRYYLEKK